MTTNTTPYETAHSPLIALLDAVPGARWTDPSPCEGWSARDVVAHMIGTQRQFLTGQGCDLGPEPDVAAHPATAWREHARTVVELLSDDRVAGAQYDGHFGRTTVASTLEQFYVWDMVVHRWDIARAVGLDAGLTDAELDRIDRGADSFGPALHLDGVCSAAVEAPAAADREVRVLARLGRRAWG